MGRPRTFDEEHVLAAASAAFVDRGYEATSVDDLLAATQLQRGSLYQAFGSKRGLFLAALRSHLHRPVRGAPAPDDELVDLLLVAALELAPRDEEVRSLVADALARHLPGRQAPAALGHRLLTRAQIDSAPIPSVPAS